MNRRILTFLIMLAFALPAASEGMRSNGPGAFRSGILTDNKGMALYVTDRDKVNSGKSSCNGPCAANWRPLKASAKAASFGNWTIIKRADGTKQWAYKGKPLYNWTHDRKPGDITGDNFNSIWHLVRERR